MVMPSDGADDSALHATVLAAPHAQGAALPTAAPEPISLSVVVPLYDEQDNVATLVQRIHDALAASPWPWESVRDFREEVLMNMRRSSSEPAFEAHPARMNTLVAAARGARSKPPESALS